MDRIEQHDHTRQPSNRSKWVLVGFLAVAAFFLWTEHRAHLLGILPYLLFLACPLMHLFHHGHGHGHGNHAHEEAPRTTATTQNENRTGERP